jgi:hypothetical protein
MRRLPVTLILLAAALALIAQPATAAAGKWIIKGANGKTCGTVRSGGTGADIATIYRHGVKVGGIFGVGDVSGQVWYAPPSAGGWVKSIYLTPGPRSSLFLIVPENPELQSRGRAVRRSGRWIVQKRVGSRWVTRGSASAACPGWMAAGAVYALDVRWL